MRGLPEGDDTLTYEKGMKKGVAAEGKVGKDTRPLVGILGKAEQGPQACRQGQNNLA